MATVYIHPQALCESEDVGAGSRIWAFAHVMRGAVVGADCNVGEGVFIESGAHVGHRVTLKNQAMVWRGVTLEDDVFVGPGVAFTNDHSPRSPRMPVVHDRYSTIEAWCSPTRVCRGASLGARAVILPGLTIGEFAMIGAGAVVTKDVPPHQIVVGSPARPIGWACRCGQRLDAAYQCESCGSQFSFERA